MTTNLNKTEQSVFTAAEVIKNAIKNNTSLSEACRNNDLNRNYVSDVNRRLEENFASGKVNTTLCNTFNKLISMYNEIQNLQRLAQTL